jgi:hypothetical protein
VHAGPLARGEAPTADARVIDAAGRTDGDPLRDIAVLQNRERATVMKGGVLV